MTEKQFTCTACGGEVGTDTDESETRCGSCGTKFTGPWNDPEVISSPLSGEQSTRTDGSGSQSGGSGEAGGPDAETAVQLDAGSGTVTVTITVEVDPRGN